ncbi:MAG: radical SAM protein, partial [Alphaproteobacteria bacterium]|nr:radical SAM protein [Alphaproteobacteria bacterium]
MTYTFLPNNNSSTRRKIILIALDWTRPKDPPLSLGLASILANLQMYNIDVYSKEWSVNSENFNVGDVSDFILSKASPLTDVALGAFVWNEKYIQIILSKLKKEKFPGRIILGGPQISYVKHNIETYYPQADIFIRGYAEEALALLMTSEKQYPLITGVHYTGKKSLGLSAMADLEHLPSPYLNGIIVPQKFIRWETQRGCPFSCSFCQHRSSDPTNVRRSFAKNRLLDEINWITSSLVNDIAVLDPTFNAGAHYINMLKVFAEKKYSGKISLQCRIEMVTPEFLEIVEEINKYGEVNLEFGLQTIHRNEQMHIQRLNNMTKVRENLMNIRKRGIQCEVSLMFGLPGQTVHSFSESIQFCKELDIKTIRAFPLMLLRGTALYEKKEELGLIESVGANFDKINRVQTDIPHVVSSPS